MFPSHDPTGATGGHQPAFRDKWAALYSRYRVLRCSWFLTFTPFRQHYHSNIAAGGTATGETHPVADATHADQYYNPAIIFWELNDSATADQTLAADKNVIRETANKRKDVRYKMTSANPYAVYHMSGSSGLKSLFDDPDMYDLSTAMGTNPSNQLYINFGVMSKDGGTCSSYRVDIKMTYVVEMSESPRS